MPRMVSLPHRHTARGCRVRAIARRAAAAADAAGRRRTSGTGATWPAGRRRFHLDPATDLASPRVRGLRLGARPQHRADGQSGIRDAGPPRQAPLPVPHPGEPDWVEPGWHLRARPRPRPSVGGAPGDHTGQPVWHEDTCETRSAWSFNRYAHLHTERHELPLEMESEPLPVPTTAIYSRCDGMVAWQTCMNSPSERAENIAVRSSHIGYGHNPPVVWAIADRLAQPQGAWAPFRPPKVLSPLFPRPDTPAEAVSTPRRDRPDGAGDHGAGVASLTCCWPPESCCRLRRRYRGRGPHRRRRAEP